MPTILLKKSDTASAVPSTANLTNLAGGAEVAVNTADKRMFTMNSSSAVVELGTNPSSLTCADVSATLIKAASANITNLSAASATITTGNLGFTGTAQRITGDMSTNGASTLGNRVMFQSSTTNGITIVSAIPNGTATDARFSIFNSSDPVNSSGIQILANASEARVQATNFGTGTSLPMTFYTGGSERVRIDTSGNVGIGGTANAQARVNVTGTLPTDINRSRSFFVNATIPSGTTANAINFYSLPSTENASFTLTDLYHFFAVQGTKGASSTITNQYGFSADSSLTGATNNFGFYSNIAAASNRWNFYAAGTARNYFAGGVEDANGSLRKIPRTGSAKTSTYTLTVSDVGQFVELGTGGGIDVPNGVFSTGDVVSVFNNTTGARTMSLTITTAYIGGTDADKASVSLATRGVATVLFISNSVCVVTGNVS